MMPRWPQLLLAALAIGASSAQAARIDEGPMPDISRYLTGCWVNVEGTLRPEAGQVSVCFEDGVLDTALLDDSGQRVDVHLGTYAFRNRQIVLTGPDAEEWVFGRATLICVVGVLPYVRLGLFDCVGSGPLPDGTPRDPEFLPEMRFTAQKAATT